MKRYVFVVDYYSKNLNIGNQRLQSLPRLPTYL
jgi:hypothetical protein